MLDEAIPGNIRKAEHFIAFLKRFIEYLKVSWLAARISSVADPQDTNEGTSRRCRDAAVLPGSFEGDHLHRAQAAQVSTRPIESRTALTLDSPLRD
jgi:hypothetical protein